MKKFIKTGAAVLALVTTLTFASCSSEVVDTPRKDYDGDILHISSNDYDFDDAFNELNHRLLRYDDMSVGNIFLPEGVSFNMGWQTMGLVWHNADALDGSEKIKAVYDRFLSHRTLDDYGYVYDMDMHRTDSKTVQAGIPQGWPFPTWQHAMEDLVDGDPETDAYFRTFEFNKRNDDTSKNWTAENGTFAVRNAGVALVGTDESIAAGESFKVYRDGLSDILPRKGGIHGDHAAFIEIDMDFKSENLDDVYLIWKTEAGGDEWFKAAAKDYVTIYNDDYETYGARTYWPMYLNENWQGQLITAIGLEFAAEEGKTLSLTDGQINYIRPGYDTRQPQFNFHYIESLYYYVNYTKDLSVLKELMPRARRATLFLTHCLQGENGLVNVGYMYGHNGIGMTIENGEIKAMNVGNGIGSSYWDIIAEPEINIESNTYFYKCLQEMAVLERICETENIATEAASIKNRAIGGEKVEYAYESSSLLALAETVKSNIQKDIQPVKLENGRWTNNGGLWNPATGRFALGIREDTGEIVDHGYVYFNEEAIVAGLGTDEQRLSVMQWINGDRTVEGDLSMGKDIYFYEFAPRFSTCDASEQFGWYVSNQYYAGEDCVMNNYGTVFSRQVQSGGAVLCWSYYDIVARSMVLGADNAYNRLKEIRKWYEKVKAGTTGSGTTFFHDYYMSIDAEKQDGIYKIQAAETNGAGAIGIDSEFLENVMMVKAVSDGLFGLKIKDYDVLSFTHGIGGLKDVMLSNLKFGDAVYNVQMTEDGMGITSIKGAVSKKTKVEFRFREPTGDYKVYIDGKETTDYVAENGFVVVTVNMKIVNVKVK